MTDNKMDAVSVDHRMSSGATTVTSRGATIVSECREASMTHTSVDVAVKSVFGNVLSAIISWWPAVTTVWPNDIWP